MKIIRIHVIAEGQTEEAFINKVLKPYYSHKNIFLDVRCVETSRDRKRHLIYRGGMIDYQKFKRDLLRWIKQEQYNSDCYFTSMVDLYRFPQDNSPYSERIKRISDPYKKVSELEKEIYADVSYNKFIPYVQLHEFEALVLVDPLKLNEIFPDKKKSTDKLSRNVQDYNNPELINENPQNAPSKRIIKAIPEYENEKITAGALITEEIGIDKLRQNCPHFNNWLQKMESLI